VLILTGPRTAGAVEAFAAVLRIRIGATILGSPTPGQTADFEQIPLQNGRFLRLPIRIAVLPESHGLFAKGLQPDVPCDVPQAASDAALQHAAAEGRIAPLLAETERPRMNEAALVAGKNPEMEAWIQSQLRKKQGNAPQSPVPKDVALRLAVDFVTAIEALDAGSLTLP
jgi:C-terminal processing protease CtpA/Prc